MGIETSGNIDIIAFSEHGDWYNWSFYLPLANSWHGMSIASSGFTAPKSFWPWECYGDWLGTDVRERELAILYNVCVCVMDHFIQMWCIPVDVYLLYLSVVNTS